MADMQGMGALGWFSAAGSLIGAWGAIEGGRTARINAERQQVAAQFEAQQGEVNAGTAIAVSQRAAEEQRRQGRYAASRALAVAAASGGGASDPTVVRLISQTKGEAAYRASVALYEGEAKARTMRLQALAGNLSGDWALENGLRVQQQYDLAATGELIKGAGSLYARYGMNGPGKGAQTINPAPSMAG